MITRETSAGASAEQTNRAMEEMQRQGQQMQRSDPSSAQAMQRAAQTGRQQQTTQNQQNASRQARQNQQSQAQAAQKQAELGLELMLDQLREAERHKLAELQKNLAELQEQVKNLIRRQAGHNLDNVNVQGAEKVAQVGAETIKDLLAKGERDAEHLPPVPQVAQLNVICGGTVVQTAPLFAGESVVEGNIVRKATDALKQLALGWP